MSTRIQNLGTRDGNKPFIEDTICRLENPSISYITGDSSAENTFHAVTRSLRTSSIKTPENLVNDINVGLQSKIEASFLIFDFALALS